MDNIEIFRLIVFNVMQNIMINFPASTSFSIDDILPADKCPENELREDYCLNTISWLQANQYIYIKSEELQGSDINWEMVFPTEKLLVLMNVKMPGSEDTFFQKVKNIGKEASVSAIQELIKELIIMGLKYGLL